MDFVKGVHKRHYSFTDIVKDPRWKSSGRCVLTKIAEH